MRQRLKEVNDCGCLTFGRSISAADCEAGWISNFGAQRDRRMVGQVNRWIAGTYNCWRSRLSLHYARSAPQSNLLAFVAQPRAARSACISSGIQKVSKGTITSVLEVLIPTCTGHKWDPWKRRWSSGRGPAVRTKKVCGEVWRHPSDKWRELLMNLCFSHVWKDASRFCVLIFDLQLHCLLLVASYGMFTWVCTRISET